MEQKDINLIQGSSGYSESWAFMFSVFFIFSKNFLVINIKKWEKKCQCFFHMLLKFCAAEIHSWSLQCQQRGRFSSWAPGVLYCPRPLLCFSSFQNFFLSTLSGGLRNHLMLNCHSGQEERDPIREGVISKILSSYEGSSQWLLKPISKVFHPAIYNCHCCLQLLTLSPLPQATKPLTSAGVSIGFRLLCAHIKGTASLWALRAWWCASWEDL